MRSSLSRLYRRMKRENATKHGEKRQ
ncbi:hypothetical protein [Edwardsiella tarda]